MKVHFELMKCINDQLTHAKHASRRAEASIIYSLEDVVWMSLCKAGTS